MATDTPRPAAGPEQKIALLEAALAHVERERDEALEQQAATTDVLAAIASSPNDLHRVLDSIARSAGQLTQSDGANVQQAFGDHLRSVARSGISAGAIAGMDATGVPGPRLSLWAMSGRTFLERRSIHVPDVAAAIETDFPESRANFLAVGQQSQLTAPLLREGHAIGVLTVHCLEQRPYTDRQIALLQTFADQAVIAIENARLFEELERRNAELAEALEQQTAMSGILGVIASSPASLEAVLQRVAESAVRLCDGTYATIYRESGDSLVPAAVSAGYTPTAAMSLPIGRGWVTGRAFLECRTIHVTDLAAAADEFPDVQPLRSVVGQRAVLSTPLLRQGTPIGAINVARTETRPFSESQIKLIETFADQAVIAIENARLFAELEDRTAALVRSVEELRALGEVGQAVSSSLDLDTVLTTIVANASRLSGSNGGVLYEYDDAEGVFILRAMHDAPDEMVALLRQTRFRLGEGTVGRAGAVRAPFAVEDVATSDALDPAVKAALLAEGRRSVLAVPLLREDRVLGGLVVTRDAPGPFPAEVVALLRTFATQSALAIDNARLYQALEEAGRHKSAFLASMSHELRTPLNAILSYSRLLREEAEDLGQDDFVLDLEKIHGAGRHLLSLINDVLDLAKIEAGKMDLHVEAFDVPQLVADVVTVARPLVEKNANALAISCPEGLGTMRADQTKLRQALLNLLSNAAKFTERGTVALRAGREASGGADWVVFEVSDIGIGMTEEQVGRLFEAFSQAEASTRTRYGSTGLGLAISRQFCRLMGGDITAESESGRGSTFTIRLPAEVPGPAMQAS